MKKILAADLFCGAGGASVGLRRACKRLGLPLELLAINHWPIAVETHTLNHPGVRHMCEAVERIDPRKAVPGGRLNLLIAAPECTNHSRARGGRPINDQSRATAWHILKWAQELYIDRIIIENVEEFREWGPVGANHKPLKSRRGETFRAFLEALRSLGYKVEDRVLNAADFGDPTTRKRLFILATRGRKAITWPTPTHSKTGDPTLFGKTKRWRPARDVIDWSVESRSIFSRKKPLSPKTMARILAGLERFGGKEMEPFLVVLRNNCGARSLERPVPALAAGGQHVGLVEPFLLHITHGQDTGRVHSVENPIPTITTAHRGEIALCESFVLGQHGGAALRPVGQPLPTITTDGAIALIEPFLVGYHSEREGEPRRVHQLDEPLPTQSTENRFAVVEPFILATGSNGAPRHVDEPTPTIVGAASQSLVEPFISSYYGTQNISPVSAPIPTITTKDRFALVLPVVNGRALDIRLRMLKPHELARAMSFGDDYKFAGNQGDQVKQIGNAWGCSVGEALCEAQLVDFAPKKHEKKFTVLEAIA